MSYVQSTLPCEVAQIEGEGITPSLLIWRRYHVPTPGILEIFLDLNPQVIEALSASPYLPIGSYVYIPIDATILKSKPQGRTQVTLAGNVNPP